MLIAAITKESQLRHDQLIPLPHDQMVLVNVIGAILLVAGVGVYVRMLRRVVSNGGRIRSDLFGLPDTLVAVTITVIFALLLALQLHSPGPGSTSGGGTSSAQTVGGLQVLYNTLPLTVLVVAILGLLIGRNINLRELFGFRRVGFLHGLTLAAGLLILLLPAFLLVSGVAYEFLGKNAQPQELVKIYQDAAKTGKSDILWQIVIAAACIAPVTEEILFRGYCYPVFKRVIGPLPAAFGTSLLFAAVHNNALSFPGLTLLALALTVVYERTGSLLVPILMHAWFNGLSLFVMWWTTTHGLAK